jgi:hypothetical protein
MAAEQRLRGVNYPQTRDVDGVWSGIHRESSTLSSVRIEDFFDNYSRSETSGFQPKLFVAHYQ